MVSVVTGSLCGWPTNNSGLILSKSSLLQKVLASSFTPSWITFSSLKKNTLWLKLVKRFSWVAYYATWKIFLKGSTIVCCEWLSPLRKDNARHVGSMRSASSVLSANETSAVTLFYPHRRQKENLY